MLRSCQFFCPLALFACLTAACSQPAGGQNRRGAGPVVSGHTTTVQRLAVQREGGLAAALIATDQARVSSEAAGIVRGVLIEIGREVRAGDPLVRLETRKGGTPVERGRGAPRP